MTGTWRQFTEEDPEFAAFVHARFAQHGLALLATLTADGSPRISGLEPIFADDHLWLAMMPNSVKGADLHRDGRFALHNATIDKDVLEGDVKVHGVAIPVAQRQGADVPDVGPEADLFATALTRISSVRVADDQLVIDTWRPGEPRTTRRRT